MFINIAIKSTLYRTMPLSTLTWKKRLAKMLRRFNLRQLQTMMRVMRWVQWCCNCSDINPCTSGTLKFHWFCCLRGTVCKGSMYQMCNWSRKIRMKPVFCRPVNGRFQTMKREWVSLMTDQCPNFEGQTKITWEIWQKSWWEHFQPNWMVQQRKSRAD